MLLLLDVMSKAGDVDLVFVYMYLFKGDFRKNMSVIIYPEFNVYIKTIKPIFRNTKFNFFSKVFEIINMHVSRFNYIAKYNFMSFLFDFRVKYELARFHEIRPSCASHTLTQTLIVKVYCSY